MKGSFGKADARKTGYSERIFCRPGPSPLHLSIPRQKPERYPRDERKIVRIRSTTLSLGTATGSRHRDRFEPKADNSWKA